MPDVTIVGAGLAGSEAAWQLAKRGLKVCLLEMKPGRMSPAHHLPDFAELVCSNSLRSEKAETGAGLLKYELRLQHSLIMEAADACRLPAGNALAVDREAFPRYISKKLREEPRIEIREALVQDLSELGKDWRMIATGPLTEGRLYQSLQKFFGEEQLYFFDAAAPLLEESSLDRSKVFLASRYDEDGEGDYLNCPMNEAEYRRFFEALCTAEKAEVHDFDRAHLFSGCQPVEAIAEEGFDTLRFGPLKPVGLKDPRTGDEAYAVVQLRRDNFAGSLWNMVGFQSRLRFPEQERVFRLIPGLEKARFARYGVMHRNSFLNSPRLLDRRYRAKKDPKLAFGGQICGVEGYLESTASGLLSALYLAEDLGASGPPAAWTTRKTICGGLAAYAAGASPEHFQPMKANFSLLEELDRETIRDLRKRYEIKGRGRRERRLLYTLRALEALEVPKAEIRDFAFGKDVRS